MLGLKTFGRKLGQMDGIHMHGISILMKETLEISLAPFTMWENSEKQVLIRIQICWHLDIGLLSLQNCEKYITIVYKQSSVLYFNIKAWTD